MSHWSSPVEFVFLAVIRFDSGKAFQRLSLELFADLEKYPATLPLPGVKGGISGSYPIWGQYERFSYPNWAAKFYLDAAIIQMKNGKAHS